MTSADNQGVDFISTHPNLNDALTPAQKEAVRGEAAFYGTADPKSPVSPLGRAVVVEEVVTYFPGGFLDVVDGAIDAILKEGTQS